MDLVFKATVNPTSFGQDLVIKWNALDLSGKRLPNGVYIYVTNSDGKIKKGKLVIQNNGRL